METMIKTQRKNAVGRLTERQIKRRVGEAWALLENPVYDEKEVLLSAELLYYNADKVKVHEEFRKQLSKQKKGSYAFRFFGTPDPNVVYIL